MDRKWQVFAAATALLSSSLVLSGQDRQQGYVQLAHSVQKISAEGQPPLYEVTLKYNFPDRPAVVIEGIGSVKSSGELRKYITGGPAITFRDPTTGGLLFEQQLQANVMTLGTGGVVLPEEADFPTLYRSGTIRTQPFATLTLSVLQQLFPGGFSTIGTGPISVYRTGYRGLPLPIATYRGEMAVLIEQPYLEDGAKRFRVRYIIRDKPRLSSTWRYGADRSAASLAAGQAMLEALVTALER